MHLQSWNSAAASRTPAELQLTTLTLANDPSRCPMVSLSYLPRMASASLPYGGLLAGTLEGACFWEQRAGNSYRPHHLALEPGGCIDLQTEINTRHCLATYRPGKYWMSAGSDHCSSLLLSALGWAQQQPWCCGHSRNTAPALTRAMSVCTLGKTGDEQKGAGTGWCCLYSYS